MLSQTFRTVDWVVSERVVESVSARFSRVFLQKVLPIGQANTQQQLLKSQE